MTATQTRPTPHATDPRSQPVPTANGRGSDGRFTQGNRFGPGNPFYRKQAEFRRAVLELFTPEDVMSLLRVMLALGCNGDVAAAKVFLEYVVGKPHKAPDPDRADHHEWQLQAESPRLADVTGLLANGVPADMANDATRDAVPHLAAARLDSVFDTLNGVPAAASGQCHPPAEQAAAPPPAEQRKREALRLLTAMLRASVADGINGKAREEHRQTFDRLTGDNGAGRTVPTADNGRGPTVPTADNGHGIDRETWPGGRTGPDGTSGSRLR
jgi:hypothetical protein